MAKQLSITLSEWVYDTYIKAYNGNLSKFIEGNLVKGIELDSGDYELTKRKLINLIQKNNSQEEQIAKLKAENGRLKSKYKEDPELKQKERAVDSMKIMMDEL